MIMLIMIIYKKYVKNQTIFGAFSVHKWSKLMQNRHRSDQHEQKSSQVDPEVDNGTPKMARRGPKGSQFGSKSSKIAPFLIQI